MNRELIANELVKVAHLLVALDEIGGDEEVDETFRARIMGIRNKMNRLAPKKSKKLRSFGVETMLRPSSSSVEDLIGVLERVVAGA